jgi:8-oxo-dGTP pyrophosphatase MutT (NUDIX family)
VSVGAPHPLRHTARILLLDPADRLLLINYKAQKDVDPARPGLRSFWFTPGGGIEPGESAEEAALRELDEEVGLRDLPVIAEIARREALNDMFERAAICRERYFLIRATSEHFDTSRLAETDQDEVFDVRWWALDAFEAAGHVLIPRGVIALARGVIAGRLPATPVDLAEFGP